MNQLGDALDINNFVFESFVQDAGVHKKIFAVEQQNHKLQSQLGVALRQNKQLVENKKKLAESVKELANRLETVSRNGERSSSGNAWTPTPSPSQPGEASFHESTWTTSKHRKGRAPSTHLSSAKLPRPSTPLIRYLLQGQRNFLDQHSDAGVAGALSFLIQHALTQLQAAQEVHNSLTVQQAMYANLHTISKKLGTYKGQGLNGFQAALKELEACIQGIHSLANILPTKKKKRSEAKIFQEMLKLLRDQARLDFRPYFYEVDAEGSVFAVG